MTVEQPRGPNGQWVSLEKHFEVVLGARLDALTKELDHRQKALELQATEYQRRLKDLNHAHARAQEALNTFVSREKYESQMEAEAAARTIALERIDERIAELDKSVNQRLTDYITRAEARQAEIDAALAHSEGAAEAAQRAAEEQGRKSKAQMEAQHRKTNRNMALAGLALTVIIAVSNWVGSGVVP